MYIQTDIQRVHARRAGASAPTTAANSPGTRETFQAGPHLTRPLTVSAAGSAVSSVDRRVSVERSEAVVGWRRHDPAPDAPALHAERQSRIVAGARRPPSRPT